MRNFYAENSNSLRLTFGKPRQEDEGLRYLHLVLACRDFGRVAGPPTSESSRKSFPINRPGSSGKFSQSFQDSKMIL